MHHSIEPSTGAEMSERQSAEVKEAGVLELSARLQSAEEALQRCERLATANRYAGAVMHEVNNPLEALSNLVFLTKGAANDPQFVTLYMEEAERQLRQLGQITRRTLTYYREQMEAADFDLIEIMDAALLLHAHRFKSQKIEVRRHVGDAAISKILAGEILQILSNLVLNALDAAPEAEGVVCARVKVRGNWVMVTISDNGAGVDERVYKNLFQPHNTSKPHGTGLGLWLSRNIAINHGGSLRCRSSRRKGSSGTTFRLTLPLSRARSALVSK
jgi:signal transduction histidine kinase